MTHSQQFTEEDVENANEETEAEETTNIQRSIISFDHYLPLIRQSTEIFSLVKQLHRDGKLIDLVREANEQQSFKNNNQMKGNGRTKSINESSNSSSKNSSSMRANEIAAQKMRKRKQKQRKAMYANIVERTSDVIFTQQVSVNIFRAKILQKQQVQFLIEKREEEERRQKEEQANLYLKQRTNILGHLKESQDLLGQSNEAGINHLLDTSNFKDIEKFLAFQSSMNTLDRVERREMQVFTDTNSKKDLSSSSTSSPISSSTSFIFPFLNFIPNYAQNDLTQLTIDQSLSPIDAFLRSTTTAVMCFTQYDDKLFALALSNGVISVRDIQNHAVYEVNHHLHYQNKQYMSRGRDIVGLEFLPDLQQIVATHASGSVSLYNFKHNRLVFFMPNFFKYSSTQLADITTHSSLCITDFKVIAQEEMSFEFICVATNARGDCVLVKITKGFLSFEADVVPILKNETFPITQIVPLSKSMQQIHLPPGIGKDFRDYTIVALISPQKLFVLQIKLQKMKAKPLFKFAEKQDSPVRNPKCCFTWGEAVIDRKENTPTLVFVVSFTSTLYFGSIQKSSEAHRFSIDDNRSGVQSYSFEIRKRVRHYTSILFIGAMYRHIFLVCDFNSRMYLVNAVDLQRSTVRSISLSNLNSYKSALPSRTHLIPLKYKLDDLQLRAQRKVRRQSTQTFSAARKRAEMNTSVRFIDDPEGLLNDPLEQDSSTHEQFFYHNSVSFSIASQTCYILCEKNQHTESQFIAVQLVPWRHTIEKLIMKKEYFNAMHFLHNLYEYHHKFAHNSLQRADLRDLLTPQIERVGLNISSRILSGKVTSDELAGVLDLNDFYKQVSLSQQQSTGSSSNSNSSSRSATNNNNSSKSSFADENKNEQQQQNQHSHQQHNEMRTPLIFVIEFLTICNQADYVFEEIRSMCFEKLQCLDIFVECLEPFILEGKITSVPNDVLTDIISFYEKKKNMRMIQQILTSLDVQNLDTKPLISLTLERQLIPALIYLSTRQREADFVTPLMSFWNAFVNCLRRWEEQFRGKTQSFLAVNPSNSNNNGNSSNQMDQLINQSISNEDLVLFVKEQVMLSNVTDLTKVQTEYLGLRTLWFFRLCMQQRLIDGEYIGDEDYVQVTLAFEIWLSYSENIRICMLRWPEVFFDVLKAFFSAKALKILNYDERKVKLAAQTGKQMAEQKTPLTEAIAEFFARTRNVSPSQCILRLVIQEVLDADRTFQAAEKIDVMSALFPAEEEAITIQEQRLRIASDAYESNADIRQSVNLAQYTRQSHMNPGETTDKISVLLSLRHQNLLSNFNLFLAYLIYESQCRDDSSYLGGIFQFKQKKIIEVVFYLAQHHKILLRLEFSKQELFKAARRYVRDSNHHHSAGRQNTLRVAEDYLSESEAAAAAEQTSQHTEQQSYLLGSNTCNYLELAQLLRSEFMLSLIKKIYPELTDRQRGELSQMLDTTDLVTARSHVLLLREQYHRAIESYIESPNKIMSSLIFEWMELNLTQSQVEDEQKFQLLKEIMRKKLPEFIRIDSEKTHILFQRFLNGAEQDIISKLQDNPALQLLYISNVVKQHKLELQEDPTYADRMKVDVQILILQIQLMCQLNHAEELVLAEITQFDFYPLKDILTICLEKQYMEASCYIYLRMGQTDMAIRCQIRILDSVMRDYKRYLEEFCKRISNMAIERMQTLSIFMNEGSARHQSYILDGGEIYGGGTHSGEDMSIYLNPDGSQALDTSQDLLVPQTASARVARFNARIDKSVAKLFSMCSTNKAYDRPTEYWFLLLDSLVEVGKKYEEMERNDTLVQMRQKFQSVIGNSIMEIAQHIPMEDLIEKIRDAETKVNIADLKSTFSKLLQLSIEANSILQRSLNYLLDDYLKTTIQASKDFIRATSSTGYCASCLEPLSSMDSIRRNVMKTTILAAKRKNLSEQDSIEDSSQQQQQQEPMIVTFACGHSYHNECYYNQNNVHVCTECLKQRSALFFLMAQRKDISYSELLAFIRSQQEELDNVFVVARNNMSDELKLSRNSSSSYVTRNGSKRNLSSSTGTTAVTAAALLKEEAKSAEETKQFKKVKALAKLKNFDKNQLAKYASIQPERPAGRKHRHKS